MSEVTPSEACRLCWFGPQLFDETLALVTEPAEKVAVLEAKAKKYPRLPAVDASRVYVFRVVSG